MFNNLDDIQGQYIWSNKHMVNTICMWANLADGILNIDLLCTI